MLTSIGFAICDRIRSNTIGLEWTISVSLQLVMQLFGPNTALASERASLASPSRKRAFLSQACWLARSGLMRSPLNLDRAKQLVGWLVVWFGSVRLVGSQLQANMQICTPNPPTRHYSWCQSVCLLIDLQRKNNYLTDRWPRFARAQLASKWIALLSSSWQANGRHNKLARSKGRAAA